jgi:hypothetical protein
LSDGPARPRSGRGRACYAAAHGQRRCQAAFWGFGADTVRFLSGLRAHNEKVWFEAHRADYERAFVARALAFSQRLAPRLRRLDADVQIEARPGGSACTDSFARRNPRARDRIERSRPPAQGAINMKIRSTLVTSSLLVSALLASVPLAHAGDAGAPAAPPALAKAEIDWDHMSAAAKKKYMKTKVLPEMKKAFGSYDAKAYKKMTCATCHGDGVDDGDFKMPNPKLPKLPPPTSRADFVELQKKKPDAVKFMGTVVKPHMAALLGEPEWSPQNTKGFGCYHCHTKEGEK